MLIINGRQLEPGMASKDPNNPLHEQAKEYLKGIEELRAKFGKTLKFVRPGFPKKNKGSDSKGKETELTEPTPPALFPIQTEYTSPTRGKEIWTCCTTLPELQPNGLWGLGKNAKRSFLIEDFKIIDIEKEPDLAYYLYYISNSAKKGNRLKLDNPKEDLKKKADKIRDEMGIKVAIWQMADDEQLKQVAAAYGIPDTEVKEADAIRFELEERLLANDMKKRKDSTIRGTSEFLQDMKVNDTVRLRAFIQKLIDDKSITYSADGRYKVGDKVIMQVKATDLTRKFDHLCSYLSMPNNADKLKELMLDVMDDKRLAKFSDKDFAWMAKVMGVTTAFKEKEKIKEMVYDVFSIVKA
jgi:hypothetical protein